MFSNDQKLQLLSMILGGKSVCESKSETSKSECLNISSDLIGKECVIRTYSAGVYVGTIDKLQGEEALIKDARIIHSWSGAKTTLDIANNGITGGNLSSVVDTAYLSNAVAIIPLTDKSKKIFNKLSKDEYKF